VMYLEQSLKQPFTYKVIAKLKQDAGLN
jgi:hypothetical protein